MMLLFNRIILITVSLNTGRYLWQKEIMQYCKPIFLLLELFCSIYTIYTYIHTFFQGDYEVLKLQFQASVCVCVFVCVCVCYIFQRYIQNPVKHLRGIFLLKGLTYFCKINHVKCLCGSEYASNCYHCVLQFVLLLQRYNGLFTVEQLKYCKEYFLIYQNQTYQSFFKSMLITSQIDFNVALTNAEATLVKATLRQFISTLKER